MMFFSTNNCINLPRTVDHALGLASFVGSGKLGLTGVRHPCLELQDNITFIANDIDMNKGMYVLG